MVTCAVQPLHGISSDVRGRLPWYANDWAETLACKSRTLAAATYIFLASLLPALAFGEQISEDTDGAFTAVQVRYFVVRCMFYVSGVLAQYHISILPLEVNVCLYCPQSSASSAVYCLVSLQRHKCHRNRHGTVTSVGMARDG